MTDQSAEPIVLKVMRFRRPQVEAPRPMLSQDAVLGSDVPKLVLPMSLTQSLVGESFTGYLHVSNRSSTALLNVSLKVELQIGNSKFVLFSNASTPSERIEPGGFFDSNVNHDLREAGIHILICTVSYFMPGAAEHSVFKRSYRFPALQPFAVVHRVAQIGASLLVEITIENATAGSIYLTSWRLDCQDGLRTVFVDGDQSSQRASDVMHLLKPRGAHNLVFRVVPQDDSADNATVSSLEVLGTLALGWHVPDGPSGCMEGHEVRVKPDPAPDLDMRVVSCPQQVKIEEPFELEIEVVNRSMMAMEPCVVFDLKLMGSMKIGGNTRRSVGRVEPSSSMRAAFQLFAAVPGLHGLQGVSLVDELTHVKSEFGVLCDVLAF